MCLEVEEHSKGNAHHRQQEKAHKQSRSRVVAHVDEDSRVNLAIEILALQDAWGGREDVRAEDDVLALLEQASDL